MALTKEQVAQLKEQLRQQVQNLPDDQKAAALTQINEMSDEAIEAMLQQQQAAQGGDSGGGGQAVFRAIVAGDIPSKKLDENKYAIAVLDIKPISKGHTVIIPKKAAANTKELPTQAFSLAKKMSKKIISKLKAEGSEIQTQFAFGEIIINVIPVFDKPVSVNSPRQETSEEELEEVFKLLRVVKRPKTIRIKKKTTKQSEVIKIPRRIP